MDTQRLSTSGKNDDGGGDQRRIIVVSNRGPLEHFVDEQGELRHRTAGGGVATALSSVAESVPLTWIASALSEGDREAARRGPIYLGRGKRLRLVAADRGALDLFYNHFCNPLLWFLQHSLYDNGYLRPQLIEKAPEAWERGYLPINQALAEAAAAEARGRGDCRGVMLHDYHLYAAPLFIRNLCPRVALQHFVHIPWPSLEAWQLLPRPIVDSIHEGLLANDSVVFQNEASAQQFLVSCWSFVPDARIDFSQSVIRHRGRSIRVWANPMAVNVFELRARLASPEAERYREALQAEAGERTIVRVDRMDPSKNILGGFRAFGRLLQERPEWRGRVKFLAFLVPSRTSIPEYRAYAENVLKLVDEINARYGSPGWSPIKVFYEQNRLQALVGLTLYDVLLVNSLADGMNLVAKEGPAVNQTDGALVLSTTAGAFEELRDGAIAVRADDVENTARALHTALSLGDDQRRERAYLLRRALFRHDLGRWLRLMLEDLDEAMTSVAAASRSFSSGRLDLRA
ncbi:MAG: trehalose-6-phosphate synthase [Dehalococcoidia bacterium]|nr:trehalose-6-phosphate synthase [Dehalococcoidia bacterium]